MVDPSPAGPVHRVEDLQDLDALLPQTAVVEDLSRSLEVRIGRNVCTRPSCSSLGGSEREAQRAADVDRVAGQDPSAEVRSHFLRHARAADGHRDTVRQPPNGVRVRIQVGPSDTARTTSCGSTASTASWIVVNGVSCPR